MDLLTSTETYLYKKIEFKGQNLVAQYTQRTGVFDVPLFDQVAMEFPQFCIKNCLYKPQCNATLQASVSADSESVVVENDSQFGRPCRHCPVFDTNLVLACYRDGSDPSKPYRLVLTYAPPNEAV